ncbi:primosomal protein N' [Phycicoccus endophyticus]|uniref:primosomal protein N' n=1 Tax=Phycicoccus endophyticus TaxID=1690220 RepID=UPI001F0D0257|nr:primosomal protein N' [Phycicoccus endophyticus]
MTGTGESEQLALLAGAGPARRRRAGQDPPAAERPVALVQVDTGLAHLDRPFEYLVPESMATGAVPGARVKVRFAGQDLAGWVLERRESAEHAGTLRPLRRLVSPEPVLTPAVLDAARTVAARYAGTLGDVLRLAVPPRHARAEQALPVTAPETEPLGPAPAAGPWSRYPAGAAFLDRLRERGSPGAAVLALPAGGPEQDWPTLLASAARACVDGGRGALLVVPDHRDVRRVEEALTAALGPGRHTRLTADQGPQARYTAFLKALRAHVPVVVGTRAAAFAPVRDLGLVAWWDDGDDLLEEPRAPYPHVREVLLARAERERAAVLAAGFVRSTAVAHLVGQGRLAAVEAPRRAVRAAVPAVRVAGEGADLERDPAVAAAHLPSVAWRAAKDALTGGPVLVQVPRRGYLPSLSCQDCRRPARCRACSGPLALAGPQGPPACRWCGRVETAFACPVCSGTRLRSSVVGAHRTAEELGRAFPGVPVERSGAGAVLDVVAGSPRLVVSTPGAEPVAEGGYAAALLLDAWALLDRPTLDAGEEALRRWCAAAALVRPASAGGAVVLAGAPTHVTVPAVEALVRWDPAWFVERELAERRELALPPTARVAAVTGSRAAVTAALGELRLPPSASTLGPLPHGETRWRALVTVPEADGVQLAQELAAMRARASARKEADAVSVRVDPRDPAA